MFRRFVPAPNVSSTFSLSASSSTLLMMTQIIRNQGTSPPRGGWGGGRFSKGDSHFRDPRQLTMRFRDGSQQRADNRSKEYEFTDEFRKRVQDDGARRKMQGSSVDFMPRNRGGGAGGR